MYVLIIFVTVCMTCATSGFVNKLNWTKWITDAEHISVMDTNQNKILFFFLLNKLHTYVLVLIWTMDVKRGVS